VADLPEILKDSPFGPDRLYLSVRSYVILLQGFFSSWERFRWDPDLAKTRIAIVKSLPYVPSAENRLPAIIVQGSGAGWRSVAPNQMMTQDPLGAGGSREFTNIVDSGVAIFAIAQNDIEASLIGWNIFNLLPTFREEAKRLGGMDFIDNQVSLSDLFDAAGLVKGAQPGQWWAVALRNGYHIGQNNFVAGHPVLENAVTAIRQRFDRG